jgi:hypothetical protein
MKMTFPSQLLISRLDSEGSSDSDKSLARSMYTPHVAATKQSRQEISDLSASHPPKSRGFVSGAQHVNAVESMRRDRTGCMRFPFWYVNLPGSTA